MHRLLRCMGGAIGLMSAAVLPRIALAQAAQLQLVKVASGADSIAAFELRLDQQTPLHIVSMHIVLTYDSASMRALRVDGRAGMQAANLGVLGSISFAAIEPNGFVSGALATVVMARRSRASFGDVRVVARDVRNAAGNSLQADMAVSGFHDTSTVNTTVAAPRAVLPELPLDSLLPRRGEISRGDPLEIALFGRGFDLVGNTVYFDDIPVAVVPSEANGTRIRFVAPLTLRSGNGERAVSPGAYRVRVQSANGQTKSLTFTVIANQ